MKNLCNPIEVKVEATYLDDQSSPKEKYFLFAYTIKIKNTGEQPAKLMRRHWVITDADGHTQEVRGDGVVGEQPTLQPGESYEYTSGAIIPTPVGSMQGAYLMQADDGSQFEAPVPVFSLAVPHILH